MRLSQRVALHTRGNRARPLIWRGTDHQDGPLVDTESMTWFDAAKIDLVTAEVEGRVWLYIVADQAWLPDGSDIVSLSEKIRNYVSFALDGQMAESYPEVAGRSWGIVIDAQVSQPPDATRRHLEEIGAAVKRHGGELRIRYTDEDSGWHEATVG
jgi:hypothetical protein